MNKNHLVCPGTAWGKESQLTISSVMLNFLIPYLVLRQVIAQNKGLKESFKNRLI